MLEQEEILREEDIKRYEKDIRRMSVEELEKNFGAVSSKRIVIKRLIKNIIWQAYEKIKAGEEEKIEGNIRTFWYMWVKSVVKRLPEEKEQKTDPYTVMIDVFTEMVMKRKLFKYEDFDFTDENWENRRIGERNPETVVFAEKGGWIRFLKELNKQEGVTILTLGGFPSALTSEYIAKELREKVEGEHLRLIGIVDYDPSGEIIGEAFKEQLKDAGIAVGSIETVIKPENYEKDEIEIYKYRLPKTEKTKLERWMEKTGGIEGEAFGLESESMPLSRLRKILKERISKENS